MATRRKLQPVPEQGTDTSPKLEDPDQRIRIVMGKWGHATEEAMAELDLFAPGWAYFLRGIYEVVDGVMSGGQ